MTQEALPPRPTFTPWQPYLLVILDGKPELPWTLRGKLAVDETRRALTTANSRACTTLRLRKQFPK